MERRLLSIVLAACAFVALSGCMATLAVDALEPEPRRVLFGEVPVATTAERVVTLHNAGDGVLEQLTFLIDAPPGTPLRFSFIPPAEEPIDLAPGESVELTVRYVPEEQQAHEAQILIRTPYQEDWGELIHLRGTGK